MPATPARAAQMLEQYRIASFGPDAGVIAKYGDAARDTGPEPIETLFHSVADAQIFANERGNLLKRDARRCTPEVSGVETGLAIDTSQKVATVTVNDTERLLARAMMVTKIELDFGRDTTTLPVWG
jgi:hypothetical protein